MDIRNFNWLMHCNFMKDTLKWSYWEVWWSDQYSVYRTTVISWC